MSEKSFNNYLNAVHCTDMFARKLVEVFRKEGFSDDTTFVFVGDHGEGFGEHSGSKFHGNSLYDEVMHVPVVLYGPAARQLPARLQGPWSTLDLKPTILSMLGFEQQVPHSASKKLSEF